MSLHARIVMWEMLGLRLGVVPDHLSATVTVPRNDPSTLKLDYPSGAVSPRVELFGEQREIAVELTTDGGNTWFEPPGCRFYTQSTSRDAVKGAEEAQTVNAVHISHLLKEALVWDVPADAMDSDGKYSFLSVSAGVILRTLWDRARSRGWGFVINTGANLTLNCTTTHDSSGRPWPQVVTLAFSVGTDLLTVLESLVDLGMIDYEWQGRTLNVYAADTEMARDRSESMIWHTGIADTAAPESASWADLVTDVLVKGEDDYALVVHNDTAPDGMRRVERVVEAGGVSTEATARLVARATLESGSEAAREITREWVGAYAPLLPFRDYRPGDYLTLEWPGGEKERVRVAQVAITDDADGLKGDVTFGTRLDDVLDRLAKRTKGIVGLASTSGSGVRPAQTARVSKRTPARADGLVVQTDTYSNSYGNVRAVATLGWSRVTTDTRGQTIDSGVEYEVSMAAQATSDVHIYQAGTNRRQIEGLLPGEVYGFRVRAVYTPDATKGQWSPIVYVTPSGDVTPPEVPSAPRVAANLGVAVITWDGLDHRGSGMALDFSHLDVSVVTPGASPTPVTRTYMPTDREVRVSGLPYGTYDVAMRAYDFTGNVSDWSETVPLTLTSLVDADAIRAQINLMVPEITDGLTEQAALYQRANALIASGAISFGPYPPDEGTAGETLWAAPDGKLWRMRSHY